MTEQSTPSDLAAWVLDHGVGLTPARQKQLAKGYRRLEAQTDIRGRAVVMYRERAREAEARIKAVQDLIDQADTAGDWAVTCSRLQWAIDGTPTIEHREAQ